MDPKNLPQDQNDMRKGKQYFSEATAKDDGYLRTTSLGWLNMTHKTNARAWSGALRSLQGEKKKNEHLIVMNHRQRVCSTKPNG